MTMKQSCTLLGTDSVTDSPVLFVLTLLFGWFIMAGHGEPTYFRKYSTVLGYFLQDDAETDPNSFDYVCLDE